MATRAEELAKDPMNRIVFGRPAKDEEVKAGDQILGEKLQELRLKYGLTQPAVARELGYRGYTSIANIESGYAKPTVDALVNLANLYGVSLDDLLSHRLNLDDE
jgi:DNA-binding XRE family transcriptional regulator